MTLRQALEVAKAVQKLGIRDCVDLDWVNGKTLPKETANSAVFGAIVGAIYHERLNCLWHLLLGFARRAAEDGEAFTTRSGRKGAATSAAMSGRLFAAPPLRALGRQACGARPALRHAPSAPRCGLPRTAPVATDIKPDKLNGSYHWDFERALSVALIPLIGTSAAYGAHPTTDLLLGVVLPLHSHIGFDACITDYVDGRKFPVLNKVCVWSLRAGTVLLLYGCYEFNTNDVGLTEGLKKIWKA
ncbi:MAG: CybS-domain-containing protein [Olpidium bornovanus]|uniref:Succinate dehydrogenase [ubiquinone] cytochrome b small subunit n=1 Tax=Olpidium bornovanus TaxID=278681 RepID=A0A8H8A090_9FUNG|nr:MAG: CybS-domain-containing protein [Olpidium bornovanus]